MDRRDFLAAWIQLLLLAIFPWMRPRPEIARKVAEELVTRHAFKGGEFKLSIVVRGYEVDNDWFELIRQNPDFMRELGITPMVRKTREELVEMFPVCE